ncbi:MAG TPA: glycosyltransferase family 4 protein [Puia sp.]|jgi:glycosyltransferase involved in cell wall biosynthesis
MIENPPVPKRKKIALVANSAWSVYNFRIDLVRHLISRFDVLVIAPEDEFAAELKKEGCSFLNIDFNNRSENPLRDYFLFRSFKKIYSEQKPDFIFHYVIKPNIYGSLAAAACGIESIAVITGLGYAFARRNWLKKTVSYLYKIALKRTREAWFLNREDAAIFMERRLVEPAKVKILPGEGINPAFFAPVQFRPVARTRAFQFLMSTRLLKSKGVSIYVEAASILKKKNRDIRFELIGFFEEQHPDSITKAEIRYWQKRDYIHYSGFARDVRPFLRQADCLVFPSFYPEGIPRCLMEAASMEVPIITSLTRGCKEVVEDGGNGFLCTVNNAAALAEKMEEMMQLSPSQRKAMGKKGRELIIEKFDVQKILLEYDRALEHI